jgi:hypothetical protein
VNAPVVQLRKRVDAYRDAGGRGKLHLQMHLSWAPDEDAALAIAHSQWRPTCSVCWGPEWTEHFDKAAKHVRPEKGAEVVHVSTDLGRHAAWAKAYAELNFNEIYLHHVGKEQEELLDAFGARVLPELS